MKNQPRALIFLAISAAVLVGGTLLQGGTNQLAASTTVNQAPLLDIHTVAKDLPSSSATSFEWSFSPSAAFPASAESPLLEVEGLKLTGSSNNSVVLKFFVDDTNLVAQLQVPGHTGAFTGSDFALVDSSVVAGGSDEFATLTMPFIATPGETYGVELDISDSSYYDVSFTDSSGPSTILMGRFAIPAGAGALIASPLYTTISAYPESASSCNQISVNFEMDVQIAVDGSPIDLATNPGSRSVCGETMNLSSYDSGSQTFTLRQAGTSSTGIEVPSKINFTNDGKTLFTSDLATAEDNSTLSNPVYGSVDANQPVYLVKVSDGSGDGFDAGDSYPIFYAGFDFSSGDIDFAGNGVEYGSNKTDYKAFAHNLAPLTADGAFTLYVPKKAGDASVGVCPGASAISELNETCDDMYYLTNEQTKTGVDEKGIPSGASVSATVETLLGQEYWAVSGLTGSGGFSGTQLGATATPDAPDTGFGKFVSAQPIVFVAIGLTMLAGLAILNPVAVRIKR